MLKDYLLMYRCVAPETMDNDVSPAKKSKVQQQPSSGIPKNHLQVLENEGIPHVDNDHHDDNEGIQTKHLILRKKLCSTNHISISFLFVPFVSPFSTFFLFSFVLFFHLHRLFHLQGVSSCRRRNNSGHQENDQRFTSTTC